MTHLLKSLMRGMVSRILLILISVFAIIVVASSEVFGQVQFSSQELSINAFRNPSIGIEYRYEQVSLHAGYYVTNFEPNITTQFFKTGLSYWFLPMLIGAAKQPSSFYAQASYLRGLNLEYEQRDAASLDVGFRWMIWEGLQVRLGIIALVSVGQPIKINPTPSLNYSFFF